MPDSPPERTIHLKFNAPDADISLVSSDDVVFRVRKANLASCSVVFRDMLETGSGGDEIPVAEDGAVLEEILPYCYPEPVPSLDVDSEYVWDWIRAFDKYQIGRGLDAAGYACELDAHKYPHSNEAAIAFYACAANFARERLSAAVALVTEAEISVATAQEELDRLHESYNVKDDGRLVNLLLRREAALHRAREGYVGDELIFRLRHTSDTNLSASSVAEALSVWFGTRHCRTPDGLQKYLDEQRREAGRDLSWHKHRWMPWKELERAMRALPTDL